MRYAVLPAKPLTIAKSRLASHLSASERQALSLAMFADVLESLRGARTVDAIAVVSADARLLDLAKRNGAMPVAEGSPRGLNGAVELGTRYAVAAGATSVLVVLSDLPRTSPEEIDVLGDPPASEPEVRLVRSHEGIGTNALLRTPPDVIATRFGGRSFADHSAAAADASVRCTAVDLPGLAFDIDTIDDLQRLMGDLRPTRTRHEAGRIGIQPTRSPG